MKPKFKGVVFDMDGVLIEAKGWHKDAFNYAISTIGLHISEEEHERLYDGLPTAKKLDLLTANEGLPKALHYRLSKLKQSHTIRIAADRLHPNLEHIKVMRFLKSAGIKTGLATNSIRLTALLFMDLAGLSPYFDSILSNEDVDQAKPSPKIYLKACQALRLDPSEVLVFEDNDYGILAATDAGCQVATVNNPGEINFSKVSRLIYG